MYDCFPFPVPLSMNCDSSWLKLDICNNSCWSRAEAGEWGGGGYKQSSGDRKQEVVCLLWEQLFITFAKNYIFIYLFILYFKNLLLLFYFIQLFDISNPLLLFYFILFHRKLADSKALLFVHCNQLNHIQICCVVSSCIFFYILIFYICKGNFIVLTSNIGIN